MTTKEKMTMQVNSEFVCNMMKQRNAGEKGQRMIKEKVNGKKD